MITKSRLKTAQNNYRQIGGKSPICELTARLCGKISHFLEDDETAAFAMNYTPPFTKDVLAEFADVSEIVVFPLYPHHSVTTVTSSLNDFEKAQCDIIFCACRTRGSTVYTIHNFATHYSYTVKIIKQTYEKNSSKQITSNTNVAHSMIRQASL